MASIRMATFFLVIFLIAQSKADVCTTGCRGASSPRGGFLEGHTYNYNLEGVGTIDLSGADNQETKVKMNAQVTVYGLGNCANLLKVTSLTIIGNDGTKYPKPNEIDHPVRFTVQDGLVGSKICAENGDSQRSLNIKRAIISLLQASDHDVSEVDVFGICHSRVLVSNEGSNQIIHRTKDLNQCTYREQDTIDMLSYITNRESEIKDSHILQSDLRSDVVVKNGIVDKAEVHENYLYKPFSIGDNGVKSHVVTKLTLKGTTKGTLNAHCVAPKSIIFENPQPVAGARSNVPNIVSALKVATEAMKNHVEPNAASKFIAFVRVLRESITSDFGVVFDQISSGQTKDKNVAKRVFLDGLLRAGTGDSIEFALSLYKDKKLSKFEEALVIASMSNVRHPTARSLKTASEFLDNDHVPLNAFLGAGALAGAYCRKHTCHGPKSQDAAVNALSTKFAAKLNCKTNDRKSEDYALAVLKGIKNIGHIEDCLVDKLSHCAGDKGVKQRIRVAALEAFHADACIPKLQQAALKILKDRQQDSELRIKAYLALIECPSKKIADEVKTLLENEPVYQVGAYISSSLKNIHASTNPSKQNLKHYFSDVQPLSKFPIDIFKYSQNYELSYEINSLGIGSTVEGDVIFSQDSFLPRSINLNLTSEIFGRQINLLELGVRQGNLDRVLESTFGPMSELRTDTPQHLYGKVKENFDSIVDKLAARTRAKKHKTKRDVQKQIMALGKKMKTDVSGYSGNLYLDAVVKIFGIESVFLSLGDEQTFNIDMIDKVLDVFDNGVEKAKNFAHDVHSNIAFLDMELAYPTSMGIPMKLNLEGAVTSKLTCSGNIDLEKIFSDPKNSKIELKLVPSSNIQIIGSLSFDADNIVQGLKTVMSLQTSTGTHIALKTSDRGFDMKLGLPVEKQELVQASSNVFFFKREKNGQDQDQLCKFKKDKPMQPECNDYISVFGLTMCTQLVVPTENTKVLFPLNGHASALLRLDKKYPNLNYHITGSNVNKNGKEISDLEITVEGPPENEKLGLKFEKVSSPDVHSLSGKCNAGGKLNVEAFVGLMTSEQEKSFASFVALNNDKYTFGVGLKKMDANSYKPFLDLNIPSLPVEIDVDGIIKVENIGNAKKFTMNDAHVKFGGDKYALNGHVASSLKPIFFDINMKLNRGDTFGALSGKLEEKDGTLNTFVETHNNINPEIGFRYEGNFIKKPNENKIDITFVHGADLKSTKNKMTYSYHLELITSPLDGRLRSKFSYPLFGVSTKFDAIVNSKTFDFEIEGEFQKKKAELELELRRQMKKDCDLYGKFKVKAVNHDFEIEGKFEEETKTNGKFYGKMELKPHGKHEMSGTVTLKNMPNDKEFALMSTYKQPGGGKEFKIDIGTICNVDVFKYHSKINVGNENYVDIAADIKKNPHSGTVKFILKDTVNAQGQCKINPDNKGNALLIIDLTKWNKKMKLESNFIFKKPTYNFQLDFQPDANSSPMTFSSSNNVQEFKIESKNFISYNNEKTELNFNTEKNGEFGNGNHKAEIEMKSAKGALVTLKFGQEATLKNDNLKASIDVNVMYVPTTGGSPCKAIYQGKLIKMNTKTKELEAEHHLSLVDSKGKDLDLKLSLKRTPKNDRMVDEGKFDVSGSMCKNHINLVSGFDYYDGKSDDEEDVRYRIKGTHGDKSSMELTGSFSAQNPDKQDAQFKNDIDFHITTPTKNSQFDLKFNSKDKIIIPDDEGKYFDISTSKSAQLNGQSYKFDGAAKMNDNLGNLKLSSHCPQQNKIALDSSYKIDKLDDSSVKYTHSIDFNYGENKHMKIAIDSLRRPKSEGQINVAADLPSGLTVKKIVTNLNYKVPSIQVASGDWKLDIDGKKHSLSANINMADRTDRSVEFIASFPDMKPMRSYAHLMMPSEGHYKTEHKIENVADFNLDATTDAKILSNEAFDIKYYLNCEKLKIKKLAFEASADNNSPSKKVKFSATMDGKNVLSGETSIHSQNEGNKYIVEGKGQVTYYNEPKSTNFKYIRNQLKDETETGNEAFFNVALGEKNMVFEHKRTNKEFKTSFVYCEEKKQCANMNINNKIDINPSKSFHHMKFSFDLRKLGIAPEFELSTTTEMEKFKLPVHNMDIHMSLDKFKYHAQAYAKPVSEAYATAAILTTPNRIVSLESTTKIPQSKSPFPLQHETAFFFNKNDPNTKVAFKIFQDYKKEEHKFATTTTEVSFISPNLGKDLLISTKSNYDMKTHEISYEAVFDIFKKKNQKVVASVKFHPQIAREKDLWKSRIMYNLEAAIDGKALGFETRGHEKFSLSAEGLELSSHASHTIQNQKREFALELNADKHGHNFLLKFPDVELINMQCKCHVDDHSHKMDGSLTLLQDKTMKFDTLFRWASPYQISFTGKIKDQPEEVNMYATADSVKKMELGVKYNDGKAKNSLAHLLVDFTGGKPKYDWKFDAKGFKPMIMKMSSNANDVITKASAAAKDLASTSSKDAHKLNELALGGAPDMKKFINTYKQELTKMSEELKADKSLSEFANTIGKIFIAINEVVVDVIHKYSEIFGNANEVLMETMQKVLDVWTSQILPALTTFAETVGQAFLKVAGAVLDMISHYVVYVTNILEKYAGDFKPFMDSLASSLKVITDELDKFKDSLKELFSGVIEFIKSLQKQLLENPQLKMLKEQIEGVEFSKLFLDIINIIKQGTDELKDKDLIKLVDSIHDYVDKKASGKVKVDDVEELNKIFQNLLSFEYNLLSKASNFLANIEIPVFQPFLSSFTPTNLPFSMSPPQFSFINHILLGHIPSPTAIIKAYRPTSLNPDVFIPPHKLRAYVAGGQHIFTFDGRHMTFPGSCKYVLAQDAVDGNFSIVLNLDNGAPKSIIVWDRSGDEIEIDNNHLTLNNEKHGFPVVKSNIQAYRKGERFEVKTRSGAFIECTKTLDLCYFEISGYYFGKLRGLLGDGNNEPFDDFRMPSGKISTNIAEFAAVYALGSSCPTPKIPDHTMHEHDHSKHAKGDLCYEVLGHKSPLAIGDYSVDIKNYRQACEHVVAKKAANMKDEVCLIVRAYYLACRKNSLYLRMPETCSQCTFEGKQLEKGQLVQVKVPQKQADIVLAFETTKATQDLFNHLAVPLMSSLVDNLKAKKVDDVRVVLVGISPKSHMPLQFDIEDAKLKGQKVTFIDQNRSTRWESPISVDNPKVDEALNKIAQTIQIVLENIGLDNFHVARLNFAATMRWRPKAVKSIIVFNAEPYIANPILNTLDQLHGKLLISQLGITANLFTPLVGLTAKDTKPNSVIGFNEESVFIVGDKGHHPELRSSLDYEREDGVNIVKGAHGNAFSTNSFTHMNPGDQKNYISLASHVIADSMTEVEHELKCSCHVDLFTLTPEVTCMSVARKDKRN